MESKDDILCILNYSVLKYCNTDCSITKYKKKNTQKRVKIKIIINC